MEDIWRDSLTTIRGGHITGTYDPIPKPPPLGVGKPFKDIQLDTARAKYWLGVGAQPSDPAWRLLSMVCQLVEAFYNFALNAHAGGTRRLTFTMRRQIGLLEPKHHVANMRQAAKNLNGPVEPATSEKSAVVRGK